MMAMGKSVFEEFTRDFIGLPLSHIWRGRGSAIFLEFGNLTPATDVRRDGSQKNPQGEAGIMIEWSWRIEGKKSILCGSWSDEDRWERGFSMIRNQKLVALTFLVDCLNWKFALAMGRVVYLS